MIRPQGKKLLMDDLLDIFPASEGSINLYYGLIGNGKTYNATADIIELLKQGKVVYCNWKILVDDFDDRASLFISFVNFLLFKKTYYRIPCKQNLHFFDPETYNSTGELVEWMSSLTDCHIFYDEGQDMFDSYEGTKFSKAKRRMILHTRHYHRTLNIITQRPTAIQVSARGNVNRFYKCVKLASWPWVRFARYEFQEMSGETVDENKTPISRKTYWAKSSIFHAYNTDYLADGIPRSQIVFFDAFHLDFKERSALLVVNFLAFFSALWPKKAKIEQSNGVANAISPDFSTLTGVKTVEKSIKYSRSGSILPIIGSVDEDSPF